MAHSRQSDFDNWTATAISGEEVSVNTIVSTVHISDRLKQLIPTAVWLAPNASLMRSHLPQADNPVSMVNVVGVANCDELGGWVLMLG